MYTIKNSAKAPRVIYDRKRRMVHIPPGKSVLADLDPVTAGRIVTHDSGLSVVEGSQKGTVDQPRTMTERVSSTADQPKVQRTVDDLIKAIDDKSVPYPEVVHDAKVVLGGKWPGGVPRKADLRELLVRSKG